MKYNMGAIWRRNDPLPKKDTTSYDLFQSKRLCGECRTMQIRRGGKEFNGVWVCRLCIEESNKCGA